MIEFAGVPDVNLVKRGETCISVAFKRSMGGVTLSVKVHPAIEEFFRTLSTGDSSDVRALGRHWNSIGGDVPLMAYNLVDNLPTLQVDGVRRIEFNRLAQQIVIPYNVADDGIRPRAAGEQAQGRGVNLSFLRLVGIGEGSGVTFALRGVMSDDQLRQMREDVALACQRFYQTYMKPVNLAVAIITQDL